MRVALNGLFLDTPASGTGQYLRHLARALAACAPAAGAEIDLIVSRAGSALPLPARLAPSYLPGDAGKLVFEQASFPLACARGGFTLAHIPHWGPPFFSSIPFVVTIHDLIPLVLPEYRGSALVRAYSRLASAGARRARRVIADSEATKKDIVTRLGIPTEKVRVVYLAADARFRPIRDAEERERVRRKYALPNRFVLYLGGFDVRKNVPLLVRAFGRLDAQIADGWKLVLAGRLPDRDTPFGPDPRVGAGPGVQSIGFVEEEDKPGLYSLARALAFPSRYEGFGLVPLEAMASGTPVLAARSSSLIEVIGDAGLLLDPSGEQDWTEALRRVMSDDELCRELAQRGLARASLFTWERTARETLDIYREAESFD